MKPSQKWFCPWNSIKWTLLFVGKQRWRLPGSGDRHLMRIKLFCLRKLYMLFFFRTHDFDINKYVFRLRNSDCFSSRKTNLATSPAVNILKRTPINHMIIDNIVGRMCVRKALTLVPNVFFRVPRMCAQIMACRQRPRKFPLTDKIHAN